MCVEMVVIPLKDLFFHTSLFSLFGVFIHRMTLWREMNVFEKPLVLLVLIGRQTVPYLQQLFITFLYQFPLYNVLVIYYSQKVVDRY